MSDFKSQVIDLLEKHSGRAPAFYLAVADLALNRKVAPKEDALGDTASPSIVAKPKSAPAVEGADEKPVIRRTKKARKSS